MNLLLDAVTSALDALHAVQSDRLAPGMCPAELVEANDALGLLRRTVDAAMAPVAAEIARQSRPELGRDSLAKREGFGTAGKMISTTTGTSVGEALRLVAVGEATAPRALMSGELAPARHPFVGEAIKTGALGTLAAGEIIAMLDRIAVRAEPGDVEAMERRLVTAAPGLSLPQLRTLIVRGEALLDPDGAQPRDDELRAQRGVTIRQEPSGAIALSGRFDPESGAPILAAVEGLVTGMLRRSEDGTSVVDTDGRSIQQMRADALSELCRHGIGCEKVPTAPSTTVVVRMILSELEDGVGVGTIDGVAHPVPAATVRQMAADARIIPCVLGGDSEILDWGRGKRIFTAAQKLALSERDGGCSFCGLPPWVTAAHHISWWARDAGPTDLDNGILLCTNCHHRIHDDGWDIRIENPEHDGAADGNRPPSGTGLHANAKVWFIPPAGIDSARTPRLGGRARYDLGA